MDGWMGGVYIHRWVLIDLARGGRFVVVVVGCRGYGVVVPASTVYKIRFVGKIKKGMGTQLVSAYNLMLIV